MARTPDRAQLGLFHDLADDAAVPRDGPAPSATEDRFIPGPLPDQAGRDRIRADLETNLLVEAGAGSGKTTALVDRMVALTRSGTAPVDEIAAVTFTRKAAAELHQRFRTRIEEALGESRDAGRIEETARLDAALRGIDRCFIGTIHSFCARLLRERPVEAGLDPGFRELLGAEEVRVRRAFWRAHLERLVVGEDPVVTELTDVGLAPSQLEGLFDAIVGNPDVDFPADDVPAPGAEEVAALRGRMDALIDRGLAMLPDQPAERGWDRMQARLRLLRFLRAVRDWEDRTSFLDTMGEEVVGRQCAVVQNRWPDGPSAKRLEEDWAALRDGPAAELLARWWAHRYPIALRFARRAADAFELERRRTGRLNFQDLLMLAARLLRDHGAAREELGLRYRRLLVDEFQDTDPVQAEVLLLLASPADGRPWQEAVPRPGALFVVGDPKQSIYRFRRADIAVYNLVRARFTAFGDTLELTANFRSLPPIGEIVDEVFGRGGRFGEVATTYQAAFAPLRTRRKPVPERQRTAQYFVDPEGRSHHAAAADGAARIVPWIARAIADGRRRPEDFLILARQKAELATYARALEAWRVPVQVTGAGVDQAEELEELLVLLDALADPSDPVRVVAVLVGLFFGLDLDTLAAWRLGEDLDDPGEGAARRFDIAGARIEDTSAVGRALHTLHGWWSLSRRMPADVLVARILDEVGLLPLAAARDLGALRAGAVLFALDALRAAALQGDASLAAATEALRTALEADEAEAPLEPIRRGVARVMTLHQAKGLEAPVVVLAHPVGSRDHEILRHIARRDDGGAAGYLVVQEKKGWRVRTIARPLGWEEKEKEERAFEAAEQDRLLYVAVTRAEDALLVARKAKDEAKSPWKGIYPWLDASGETLVLEPGVPPVADTLERDPAAVTAEAEAVRDQRAERARETYVVRTATGLAKAAGSDAAGPAEEGVAAPAPHTDRDNEYVNEYDNEFRGLSWGSAVHGALDAAARGASGDRLRVLCRSLLLETGRPADGGEPTELDELVTLVERVLGSELWARARAAERVLSEVPFAFHAPPGWLPDPDTHAPADAPRILEGVVDLAFLEPDGWVLVDYKTDVGTDAGFERRRRSYRRQVDLYAGVWAELTGGPVKERALYFTARPEGERLERW